MNAKQQEKIIQAIEEIGGVGMIKEFYETINSLSWRDNYDPIYIHDSTQQELKDLADFLLNICYSGDESQEILKMSINMVPDGKIGKKEILSFDLEKDGVGIDQTANNTDDSVCLTDGKNFLWTFFDKNKVKSFVCSGGNNVLNILEKLETKFCIEIR